MGLVNLENKIRENRAFFDVEPSENHLEKFQSKLAQVELKKIRSTEIGIIRVKFLR